MRAAPNDGRFPPGSLLADRYRVISLIGRGGMGEVYRASDLTLNQPVALKFLPQANTDRPDLLERFHGEVRTARQVSHPNVCRVYDIGQAQGETFISMEYVDGEDLASLLRRIGRLPADKALEIARKLCAGVAAAHAKGVLHRDLKPANIMIDGRGQALIMDFGLAAVSDHMAGVEVLNGTPAYMAPEQLAGKEVTQRSDIYSLGLVLYEIFTGQRAFENADRSVIPSAAIASRDVDPLIDGVIRRCIDPNPAKRPQTALAVARMLPGGDPLAEALAAGDTPTPTAVAASEDTGTLSVRGAVVCLSFVFLGLTALLLMSAKSSVLRLTPLPYSHEVLAQKAREVAVALGYPDTPADHYNNFIYRANYRNWAQRNVSTDAFRDQVRRGQPALAHFLYRQSPQYFEPRDSSGRPGDNDPPMNIPGMVHVELDPQGRLTRFQAVPPQQDSDGEGTGTTDWNLLFETAGLDRSRWTETIPREIPPFGFDERKAWTGTYLHAPDLPLRIEAAAWNGKPVSFDLFGPWRLPVRVEPPSAGRARQDWMGYGISSLLLLGATWLAWLNHRMGRADATGALRLAAFGFVAQSVGAIVAIHHVPTPAETSHVTNAIALGLFVAAAVGVLYMAVEPFLRRRWPQSLISWTRLLNGRIRDPLVAGHIVMGTAFGIASALVESGVTWYRWATEGIITGANQIEMLDLAWMTRWLMTGLIVPAALVIGLVLLFLIFRLMLRKTWIAAVAVAVLGAVIPGSVTPWSLILVFNFVLVLWVALVFGVLPATMILLIATLTRLPVTSDLSAWYAMRGLIVIGLVMAVALWSFRHALGGRRVLQDDLLGG